MTSSLADPAAGSSTRPPRLQRLLVLVTLGVSLLFLYAGAEKWADIGQFERIVVSHGLIGQTWAGAAGRTLAGVELGVGAAGLLLVLLGGLRWAAPALLAQSALFLGFAMYAALLTAQPPAEPTSCGCGVLSAPIADWPGILTRNAIAAAAVGAGALLAARWRRGRAPS